MTDTTAPTPQPRAGQQIRAFLASDNLLARIGMLAFLTLILLIPLGMIGGVIADRASTRPRRRGASARRGAARRPSSARRSWCPIAE